MIASGYAEDVAASAAHVLRAEGLPTAVIVGNDLSAIGLLDSVARAAGVSVLADLSLVGYDDSRFARLSGIEMTSVRQDIPEMAEVAVQAAVERLDLLGASRRCRAGTTQDLHARHKVPTRGA